MKKRDKKTAKKALYKHINSWVPTPCLRLAGAGYDMQGFGLGQAGQADLTDKNHNNSVFVSKKPKKHFFGHSEYPPKAAFTIFPFPFPNSLLIILHDKEIKA